MNSIYAIIVEIRIFFLSVKKVKIFESYQNSEQEYGKIANKASIHSLLFKLIHALFCQIN